MNPARECRVCKLVDGGRDADFVMPPLADLVQMLPDPAPFKRTYEGTTVEYFDDSLAVAAGAVFPVLHKAAGGCPACVLAAIRQRGIPVPVVEKFSFKNEMDEIFSDINEDRANRYDND